MAVASFWDARKFPAVYENGEMKAVLVDAASFAQMEMILDNLLNREAEPEDAILAASSALSAMLKQVQQATPSEDWERELDEL